MYIVNIGIYIPDRVTQPEFILGHIPTHYSWLEAFEEFDNFIRCKTVLIALCVGYVCCIFLCYTAVIDFSWSI